MIHKVTSMNAERNSRQKPVICICNCSIRLQNIAKKKKKRWFGYVYREMPHSPRFREQITGRK